MKKTLVSVFAMLLSFVMILSFASCGKKGDESDSSSGAETLSAYETYSAAMEKLSSLEEFHQHETVSQDISFSLSGQDFHTEYHSEADVKVKNVHSNGLLMEDHATDKVTSNGQVSESSIDVFIGGGKYYVRQNGAPEYSVFEKGSPETETFEKLLDGMTSSDNMMYGYKFGEDAFAGATMAVDEDGYTRISANPSDDSLKEYVDEISEQFTSYFEAMGASVSNLQISDAVLSYTISPDGYFSETTCELNISMDCSVFGIEFTARDHEKSVVNYVDPGSPVSIEFPET